MSQLLPMMLAAAFSQAATSPAEQTTPADPAPVVWTGTLPRRPGEDEMLVLLQPAGGPPSVALRRPHKEGPVSWGPLPLFSDLLATAQPVSFGSDGRCEVGATAKGNHRLDCRPGTSISGATWMLGGRVPVGGAIGAQFSTSGDRRFRAEITARGADATSPALLATGNDRLRLPQPVADQPIQLAVFGPTEGGTLELNRLEIVPSATPAVRNALSAWAWEADLWRNDPAALVAAARSRGIGRLFVSLDIARGVVRDARALGRFVTLARAAGVEVEAVEGDPRMVQPEGLQQARARAEAFAAYQRRARPAERLAGIQYDVEPYILPGWGKGQESYDGWASAIVQLAAAAGEPVDLVLPFWVAGSADGAAFLNRVAPAVRVMTVMSYRTDAAVLSQIAEPLLAWGSRHGKSIRLSLEAGPLPDEVEEVFIPAAAGTLAVMPGPTPRVLQLASAGVVPGARMYRFHQRTTIRGSAQSFLGSEAPMLAMATATAPTFSAWPAFSGFALHGLDWSRAPAAPSAAP
ncbi:hypothetical protein OKW76_01490 [Sphingomonas sp. S1-29]|uniref:hypothetical protein n=1 Tax=Sphingomonas sp. S1-29 TaxID=2991074 RepID=UPI002240593B|nr:hypothetical protein [Sphingomonas sp. S1-29]UZK71172.1 hypothetical protein OKW76_01490 [Sphingomonas sp. S1-29]